MPGIICQTPVPYPFRLFVSKKLREEWDREDRLNRQKFIKTCKEKDILEALLQSIMKNLIIVC